MAACKRRAVEFGARTDSHDAVVTDTAKGALIGGAAAGAWGAVRGDAGERAAAGAAAGAAGGLVRGILRADKPSSTYKKFVARCLQERGYEVIGWR